MRKITTEEWQQYDWVEAAGFGDDPTDGVIYIRGVKKTQPPDDGFVYVERTGLGDSEQRWVPAVTYEEGE